MCVEQMKGKIYNKKLQTMTIREHLTDTYFLVKYFKVNGIENEIQQLPN